MGSALTWAISRRLAWAAVAANRGFGSFRHLAGRFFGALDPRGPSLSEEGWALGWLLPGEQALWRRMSGPDRRHAAGVARQTATLLVEPEPDRAVMASALLHDVGKLESGLGTFARVAVTLVAMAQGRERLAGSSGGGWRGRAAAYLAHDRIGAEMLRAAGSDPTTVAWAAEHHLPPEQWTLERRVADALKSADDD